MICSLQWVGNFWTQLYLREFADGIQILPENALPGDEVFSYPRLGWWNHRTFHHTKPCRRLSMRGVAHWSSSHLWQRRSSILKNFTFQETTKWQMPCQYFETDKAPYYAARILDNVPSHQVHNGCKTSSCEWRHPSINNVVTWPTISAHFGQPMHTFDLDTFEGTTSVYVKRVLVKISDLGWGRTWLDEWPSDYGRQTSSPLQVSVGPSNWNLWEI